jgi:putative spermidine/putrescine transport system permease protein
MTAIAAPAAPMMPRLALGRTGTAAALLLPIAIINAIGFILPVLNLARMSFNEALAGGGVREAFTLANWTGLFSDTFYVELIVNSIMVSLGITLATLVVSYPIALYLHRSSGRWRTFLTVLVISPLLTSAVVRTYGWMILSLLAGFGRLDPRVEEAAMTLGAPPAKTFWRVILPLTLPGIALGCLLCFVLAVSSFITPKLLGGGRVFLLATEIYDQAIVTLNWPLAATLSMLVLIIFGAALGAYARVLRAID